MSTSRLPRQLHPGAWWLWAIGVAAAASRTTNPLTLLVLAGSVALVVAFRRTDAPWARGFGTYIKLALLVIVIRVVLRIFFGAQHGDTVLFTLPELDLPDAAAGIRIGGPVTLEGLLAALYDGIRLATLLLCIGAANMLANPKRLLKSLPPAIHELGVAVTVALTVAPQLVESGQRIRRARRLRNAGSGRRGFVRGVAIPVLEDALDRSLVLAAAMDSRGYGRHEPQPRRATLATGALMLLGVAGVCVGVYATLDGTAPRALGAPTLAAGCLVAVLGVRLAGRRVRRTIYRPDPWRTPEWTVTLCGMGSAVLMFAASQVDPEHLYPSLQPLRWPELGLVPALAALVATLPAWLTPPVAVPGSASVSRDVAVAP